MLRYRVSPEGYIYLFIVVLLTIVTYHFYHSVLLLLADGLLLVALLYIYRDSLRSIPATPLGIIAPVDGRITAVEVINSDRFESEALVITIKSKTFGCYVLRGPTEGKVSRFWVEDKKQYYCIETDEGDKVALGLDVGWIGNRPRLRAGVGERIGQGRRFGFIPVAAEVRLVIAGNPRANIAVGDKVRSGESIIATIRRS